MFRKLDVANTAESVYTEMKNNGIATPQAVVRTTFFMIVDSSNYSAEGKNTHTNKTCYLPLSGSIRKNILNIMRDNSSLRDQVHKLSGSPQQYFKGIDLLLGRIRLRQPFRRVQGDQVLQYSEWISGLHSIRSHFHEGFFELTLEALTQELVRSTFLAKSMSNEVLMGDIDQDQVSDVLTTIQNWSMTEFATIFNIR